MAAVLLASCGGDSPTGLPPLNASEVAVVSPVVFDARQRLADAIADPAIRIRVREDLERLETALARLDARSSTARARSLVAALEQYAVQPGSASRADAADVVALALAVLYVADLLDVSVNLNTMVPNA